MSDIAAASMIKAAVDRMNHQSSEQVQTTNRLTKHILILTWTLVPLAVVQTVFTVLAYFKK